MSGESVGQPEPNQPDRLRDRLVLAALDTLVEGDPVLVIGVGDHEVSLGWADDE